MLSRNFLDRVRIEGIVETRKYRYIWDCVTWSIIRKPLELLDTTLGWETVASFKLDGCTYKLKGRSLR